MLCALAVEMEFLPGLYLASVSMGFKDPAISLAYVLLIHLFSNQDLTLFSGWP